MTGPLHFSLAEEFAKVRAAAFIEHVTALREAGVPLYHILSHRCFGVGGIATKGRGFEFDEDGEEYYIFPVWHPDGWDDEAQQFIYWGSLMDLVAFKLDSPEKFYLHEDGACGVLGLDTLHDHQRATFAASEADTERHSKPPAPLMVYETPLEWMCMQVPGVCVLNDGGFHELYGEPKIRVQVTSRRFAAFLDNHKRTIMAGVHQREPLIVIAR